MSEGGDGGLCFVSGSHESDAFPSRPGCLSSGSALRAVAPCGKVWDQRADGRAGSLQKKNEEEEIERKTRPLPSVEFLGPTMMVVVRQRAQLLPRGTRINNKIGMAVTERKRG